MSSLCIQRFHMAFRVGQICPGLVVFEKGFDLIVVRPRERVLRLHDFDVIGDAGGKAVARLLDFLLRELYSEIRNVHLVTRSLKLGERRLYFECNFISQIFLLLLDSLDFQICACNFRMDAASGKEWDINAGLILINRDPISQGEALIIPVSVRLQSR